ncbi:hypothetical protein MASR2M29_12900 [Spirochaetota bacterium]
MRFKSFLILALLMMTGLLTLHAQTGQSLIIEFVDGNNLDVIYPDSTIYSFSNGMVIEGDSVPVGAIIKTGAGTSAELRLRPNGTVIKLAKLSTFKVEGLASPEKDQNGFSLISGKVRTVAAKGSQYSIYTSNTVAGVRGTDFSMSFEEGKKALLLVKNGSVEFAKRLADGSITESIFVGAGQFADFFKGFSAAPFGQEILDEEYGDMDIASQLPESSIESPEQQPKEEPEEVIAEQAETAVASEIDTADTKTQESKASDSQVGNAVVEWLKDVVGMEIGSITINGETWAKAVIQPNFKFGKLGLGLYLPIIYSSNLFDPQSWYHPAGNDEWSFGFDKGWNKDNWSSALLDAANDIALKIKYIEYGKQFTDPFYFKFGNLNNFTVGHGLIMRNYANDSDFPSVRQLGVNLGVDAGSWGFEVMTNDLIKSEVFGGRLFIRPIPDFKLALGFSGVADINPASVVNESEQADKFGNPIFIASAIDLDLPIVSSSVLGIRMFADAAVMVPYVRDNFNLNGNTGESGLRYDMILTDSGLQNWGASGGFIGNILFVDWRLEYRYFTGAFRPAFFDTSYDRRRASLVKEWAGYLSGEIEAGEAPTVMGVYGEGGTSILKDKLNLSLGYFWPWSNNASLAEQLSAADDYFKAALVVKKGLIPVLDISGAIVYERRGLVKAIKENNLSLFDENTVFSGELSVPVPGVKNLDIAMLFSTAMARDSEGKIEYMDDNPNKPKIIPVLTLETRLHF